MTEQANPKGPLRLGDPLDMDDARRASHLAAQDRRQAVEDLAEQVKKAAESEKTYRRELAKKLVELRDQGRPVTLIKDLAKGDSRISELAKERDIDKEMIRVEHERLEGLSGERAMLRQLVEMSARSQGVDPKEAEGEVFGRGRRAA